MPSTGFLVINWFWWLTISVHGVRNSAHAAVGAQVISVGAQVISVGKVLGQETCSFPLRYLYRGVCGHRGRRGLMNKGALPHLTPRRDLLSAGSQNSPSCVQ